ncbi:MAG: hypothetical protein AAGN35_18830 [Bacteroidota bacterium]
MDRKRRFFKRILLVVGSSAVLFFAVYVIYMKRSSRHYHLPEKFSGWVTIRFETEGAPPLEEKDGVYHLYIPESGVLETSTRFQTGWARDAFFRRENGQNVELPMNVKVGAENRCFIHDRQDAEPDHLALVKSLPDGVDTVLWDGTRISKSGTVADVRTGRKLLEHFWVSREPEPYFYPHDSLPADRNVWPHEPPGR